MSDPAKTLELLERVRSDPADLALREVFADWCSESGWEAMGTWLALEARQRDRFLTPEERAAFRASAGQLLVRQRALVTRGRVTHCDRGDCVTRWEALDASRETTRRCLACDRSVVFCDTEQAAREMTGHYCCVMLEPSAWSEDLARRDRADRGRRRD